VSPTADLHDVWKTHLPLSVACQHCLHRALVDQDCIGAREGNLRCVDTLRFRCTKCKRGVAEIHLFPDRRGAKRFMADYR